jgi:Rieske 2Fe-2S family protein
MSSVQPTTLPQKYYTDPELYRAELERFFFGQWICVGRAEQVAQAGSYFLAEVGGESVIVTKDAGGELRAHYNVCRHRGTRMCTEVSGTFPNGRIRCPYHSWTYGLDGALIAAPQMEIDKTEYSLHVVNVAEWGGHLFLNFSREAALLEQQLGELRDAFAAWKMAELRLHRRIVYDVRANWKLIVSNYNECLHCPTLHPSLNRLTDYMGAENVAPTTAFVGGSMGFKPGIETMSTDGKRRRAYLPGLSEAQRKQVVYYAIFPNLLLSLHPDYMMTHTLWPRAVDRTEIVCEFHFHPEELAKEGFVADDAIEFWDQTNREDWRISELSHLGISSRAYTPGPYSKREELLWAFDQVVQSRS